MHPVVLGAETDPYRVREFILGSGAKLKEVLPLAGIRLCLITECYSGDIYRSWSSTPRFKPVVF